jgi:Kef-type K+ transport system membrane component KefB
MDIVDFFLSLVLILLSAKIFSEAFVYLKLPSVIGELIAGIIIGPSLLGLVESNVLLHHLAEIGILLLLFEIGLETDFGQVIKVGIQSTLIAVTGVILPGFFGFWVGHYMFDLSLIQSLFIGGALVATSIGITMRVFMDLKKENTKISKVVLGAAVIDDVIGVVILAIIYNFAIRGSVSIIEPFKIFGIIIIFLSIAPAITKFLVPFLKKVSLAAKTEGVIPALIVSLILIMATVFHKIGAPHILGSFAAGIALARHSFLSFGKTFEFYDIKMMEEVKQGMKPIINLFVPIFFVMVGVSIDLKAIEFASSAFWGIAIILTLGAIITKMISGFWYKGDWNNKLSTGIAMVPRGEVGLVFAEIGLRSGFFDKNIYASVVFVVAFTTLLAPSLLRISIRNHA